MVEMNTTTPSESAVATVSPTPAAVDTVLPVSTSCPTVDRFCGSKPISVPSPKKLWARLARARASSRSVGKASANWRDWASTAGTSAIPKSQISPASTPVTTMTPHVLGHPLLASQLTGALSMMERSIVSRNASTTPLIL
jgi:hypothetical protein